MAVTVNVAGLATIKINAGSGLETLGYTRNGADLTFESRHSHVPGDENGGDEGPPVEVQYMGETARIRLELTKYDVTVADKLAARLAGGVAGTPGTPGTLLFSGSKTYRILVHSTTTPFNFPRCSIEEAFEINKGTKFSTLVITATAYKDGNGVLYNASTT